MAAAPLINLFSNAQYDVTRYPSHVAILTDSRSHHRLGKVVEGHLHSRFGVVVRYVLGMVATVAVPFSIMHWMSPEECDVIGTVHKYFTVHHREESEPTCLVGLRESLLVGLLACILGPMFNLVMAMIMSLSLLCTTRLYKVYVGQVLCYFRYMQPYVQNVLFSKIKPTSSSLGNVLDVWARLSHPAYMICYWFCGIIFVVVSHEGIQSKFTFATTLALVMYQTYLPMIVWIFGSSSTLREVIKRELSYRELPRASHKTWLPAFHRAAHESHDAETTDLWWRLFVLEGRVFTCSMREVFLVLDYFERSQAGIDGKSWPITWHDDLCISGTDPFEAIYLDDLDLLLTADFELAVSGATAGSTGDAADKLLSNDAEQQSTNEDDRIVEKFLADVNARIQRICDGVPRTNSAPQLPSK